MTNYQLKKKEKYYNHFEAFAPDYHKYRENNYRYYWKDIIKYYNFYIHPDNSVLEIGCGTGEMISKLKGVDKTGIDFSAKMIAQAKTLYPEIDFRLMEAENITLDKKYDVIVLSNVVGYFYNLNDVFDALRNVCHEHTKIIISYYNYLWEPAIKIGEFIGFKKKTPNQSWLTQKDLSNILYLSGFETFRSSRRLLIPLNIPIISWLTNKYIAKLPLFNLLCLNNFVTAYPTFLKSKDYKEKYSTTVVIPARNESGNIEDAIKRLPQFGKHIEIIFIEGNSTDDTWDTIQEIQKKYSSTHDIKIGQQSGKGKGDAVRKGYDMATGDILMILDADLTVPPEDLPKFYDAIASGAGEFINGCRLVYPMEKNAMRFLNALGNKFFSVMFSWLLEQTIRDSLCGTKVMFRKDYIRLIKNRSFFGNFDPFGDFDLLFGAYKLNLKIIDLPIRYQERTYGDTNISRFKHGLVLLRMCAYAAGKIKFW